jgi:hypothetical protein
MSLLDLLLRDNAALRDAEKQLRRQEDHVFRLVDGEDRDLGTHVRADIPRFEALNARQRLGQARFERKSDLGLVLTALGFAAILAKLFGAFDVVVRALGAV